MAWSAYGQYNVGITDLEWLGAVEPTPDAVDPKQVRAAPARPAPLPCGRRPHLRCWPASQHLVGRIYYPCTSKRSWWRVVRRGVPWMPGLQYAYGKQPRRRPPAATHRPRPQHPHAAPPCPPAGLSEFIFFRRPRGFLYYLAKKFVMLVSALVGTAQLMDFFEVSAPGGQVLAARNGCPPPCKQTAR